MLRDVVVAEYCVSICLCLITLALRYLIHRHRSVAAMWKTSPALCVLLVLVVPMAFMKMSVIIVFNAAILGILDNVPRKVYLMSTPFVIEVAIYFVYSSLTIAIFLQRIFYLLFPLRNIRTFNIVVFSILSASAVGCGIVSSVLILTNLSPNEQPLPPGCFSFNCMPTKNHPFTVFPLTANIIFSGVILTVGTVMFILIYAHRKQHQSATTVKVSTFTLYVFYTRLVFETIPCFLDVTLSHAVGIRLGTYIGPYGIIGRALEIAVTTALYYKVFRPPQMIVTSIQSRTDQLANKCRS